MCVRRGTPAPPEGRGKIYLPNRALWIATGLLLCLLVAILTAMLMAARAVVA